MIQVKPDLGYLMSLHITLNSEQGVGTVPHSDTSFLTCKKENVER